MQELAERGGRREWGITDRDRLCCLLEVERRWREVAECEDSWTVGVPDVWWPRAAIALMSKPLWCMWCSSYCSVALTVVVWPVLRPEVSEAALEGLRALIMSLLGDRSHVPGWICKTAAELHHIRCAAWRHIHKCLGTSDQPLDLEPAHQNLSSCKPICCRNREGTRHAAVAKATLSFSGKACCPSRDCHSLRSGAHSAIAMLRHICRLHYLSSPFLAARGHVNA